MNPEDTHLNKKLPSKLDAIYQSLAEQHARLESALDHQVANTTLIYQLSEELDIDREKLEKEKILLAVRVSQWENLLEDFEDINRLNNNLQKEINTYKRKLDEYESKDRESN